jgi:hypothetical protein
MARELAESTLERLRLRLQDERERLEKIIEDHEREREASKLAEASADRSADPDNVDGGAIEVEIEMDIAMVRTPGISSNVSNTRRTAWRRVCTGYAK